MKTFLFSLLFYITFYSVYSSKDFHNGILRESFLRPPPRRVTDGKNYTRWLTQNLDHFDVENSNTWQQRYFVNDEFFDQTNRSVAFLFIGGESEASDTWMTNGAWIDYAKANKAILFHLEHRFYGKSRPTEDVSVENLRYLTSQQALADIAVFVNAANAEYNLAPDVKWIAFGGSYAGSLAAWLRQKYPHLIHGAVSSSGPLLAISNFQDYFGVVSEDLFAISEDCYNAVKTGFADVEEILQQPGGRQVLTNLFKPCNPLENATDSDISMFFSSVANDFAELAQFNNDSASKNLRNACDIMTDTSRGKEINRLADYFTLDLDWVCVNYMSYSDFVDLLNRTRWNGLFFRPWVFQTCNEFGFFQTSDKEPHVFGHHFPLSHFIQPCIDIFGEQFNGPYIDAAVNRTNTMYGGLDIEVTNVVFVHGSWDPWHALGITKTQNPNAPAIFINGTSHGADLHPPSDSDLPALKDARIQIGKLIQTWLNL